MKKHLDLGCGDKIFDIKNALGIDHKNDQIESFGIDIQNFNFKNFIKCDLFLESIPFENDFFDYVTALDFMEHVPRYIFKEKIVLPYIELMNEVYRVLKVGGKFFIKGPPFNQRFFNDPTHVNPITIDSIVTYFASGIHPDLKPFFNCTKTPPHPWSKPYGFKGNFEVFLFEINDYSLENHDKKIPEQFLIGLEKI